MISSARLMVLLGVLISFLAPILARNISEVALPDCGIACYEQTCNTTANAACTCSDPGLQSIEGCLVESCLGTTVYLTSLRILYEDCGVPRPVWTVDPDFTTTAIVAFMIQTGLYILRVATKMLRIGTGWGWDDAACAVAYVLCVTQFILCILIGQLGQFANYWTLDFENLPSSWKLDFARGILYGFALAACKAAILFFYQRVFSNGSSRIKYVLWATHALNLLLSISYLIQSLLLSQPLRCNFLLDQESDCVYNDVWFGSGGYSAVNAVLDVILVLIPAFMVSRLKMGTCKKAGVIAVFATGILTCLIAIARFALKRVQGNSPNLTAYQNQAIAWTNYYSYYVELTCSFMIACLPACKQLFTSTIWPYVKTTIVQSTTRGSRGGTSPFGTAPKGGTAGHSAAGKFKRLSANPKGVPLIAERDVYEMTHRSDASRS